MARDTKKRPKLHKSQKVEPLFWRRRMFVITPSGIVYASENDHRSSVEWLTAAGFVTGPEDPVLQRLVRGFVDHRGIVAYRGPSFEHIGVSLPLYPVLHLIQEDLELPGDTPVWLGARPSASGYGLEGTRFAGHLDDLLKKYIARRLRPAVETRAKSAA
ncbi:hypothetical protein [Microvirga massiliensis]|uniref:hypothetical protein n=1 Tax=Microvirga massiliensis TaxID=1033741 RepID=UPI00062BDB55|nr:hypothetical protein [Microvirga massiliensis]